LVLDNSDDGYIQLEEWEELFKCISLNKKKVEDQTQASNKENDLICKEEA
jgi:hypothetical protein